VRWNRPHRRDRFHFMTSPYPPGDIFVYATYAAAVAGICFGLFVKNDMIKGFKYRDGTPASPVAVRIIAIVSGIAMLMMLIMNRSSK
jgi:tetrahydromethanopterin S-methyltransferase subunit E